MARLMSGFLPNFGLRRFRRRLPPRLSVFTFTTRTLKIFSTASGISGLLALGVHLERVDVLLDQRVRLLAHDRLDDHVTRIFH